jgi:hypothetical protein
MTGGCKYYGQRPKTREETLLNRLSVLQCFPYEYRLRVVSKVNIPFLEIILNVSQSEYILLEMDGTLDKMRDLVSSSLLCSMEFEFFYEK